MTFDEHPTSEIELPERAPKIVKAPPREPKIRVVKQIFAVGPARALKDPRILNSHLRALWALGVHASVHGVCYPRLERIAAVANRSRTWAFERVRELEEDGLRSAAEVGEQEEAPGGIPAGEVDANAPLPPRIEEEAPIDRTLRTTPWMFSNSDPLNGDEDMEPVIRAPQDPKVHDDAVRRAREAAMDERKEFDAGQRLARYFADAVGRLSGTAPSSSYSEGTARKWLRPRLHGEGAPRAHRYAHDRDEGQAGLGVSVLPERLPAAAACGVSAMDAKLLLPAAVLILAECRIVLSRYQEDPEVRATLERVEVSRSSHQGGHERTGQREGMQA